MTTPNGASVREYDRRAPRSQRYLKRCLRCGELMGPMTAYQAHQQTYCSTRCAQTQQWQTKSSRTLKVEELGQNPTLTSRQIGEIVGVSHQRVSYILQRKRREQDGGAGT